MTTREPGSGSRWYFDEDNVVDEMGRHLFSLLLDEHEEGREVVVLCIGTDRVTGDSLAPFVGSDLINEDIEGVNIHGTIHDPVHAENFHDKMSDIEEEYDNPIILAIDSGLCRDKEGRITVKKGTLSPGTAVDKALGSVGDISIIGVVNDFIEGLAFTIINNTRLSLVIKMKEVISAVVLEALHLYNERINRGDEVRKFGLSVS